MRIQVSESDRLNRSIEQSTRRILLGWLSVRVAILVRENFKARVVYRCVDEDYEMRQATELLGNRTNEQMTNFW